MIVIQVGGIVVAARRDDVESSGPYSTVRGQVTLPQASDSLLIVITTQHHAKVTKLFILFLFLFDWDMLKYFFVSRSYSPMSLSKTLIIRASSLYVVPSRLASPAHRLWK